MRCCLHHAEACSSFRLYFPGIKLASIREDLVDTIDTIDQYRPHRGPEKNELTIYYTNIDRAAAAAAAVVRHGDGGCMLTWILTCEKCLWWMTTSICYKKNTKILHTVCNFCMEQRRNESRKKKKSTQTKQINKPSAETERKRESKEPLMYARMLCTCARSLAKHMSLPYSK